MNNRQCQSQIDELGKNFNFMKARLVLGIAFALLFLSCATPLQGQVTYQDLYEFNCATGGCYPLDYGQMAQGKDGNMYGTSNLGGDHAFGAVFMLTPSGTYSETFPFDGITGESPEGGLTLANDGNFYGTANLGGYGVGSVFVFTPPNSVSVLHSFNGNDGALPAAPPTQAKDNNLYGVTSVGTTYSITLPAGIFTKLPGTVQSSSEPLLLASDGNLYGVDPLGGTLSHGTVFRMTVPAGTIKTIYNFDGPHGAYPYGALIQGPDGNLYGTTYQGGANGVGEVFKITLAGKITVLRSFDAFGVGNSNHDGAYPASGLALASDGYLYGTNSSGGANGDGTLFQISTSGSFNKLFDFTGYGGSVPGLAPVASLMEHTSGVLYGLTEQGGSYTDGNAFSLTPVRFSQILKVVGPIFVHPGVPVEILGNNLTDAAQVTFGSVQAQFQPGTDNYLSAIVPNNAIDSLITVTLDTGLQIQTQMAVHIVPAITNLDPPSGPVGTHVGIVGGGFNGATKVTFGGVKATSFVVATPSLIQAIVPTGAKTGKVVVTTPNGTATSTQTFTVQ